MRDTAALPELTIKTEPFQGKGQVLVMEATEVQCHYCQCPRGAPAPRVTSPGSAGWSSVWRHQAQVGQACCPSHVSCARLRRAQSFSVGTVASCVPRPGISWMSPGKDQRSETWEQKDQAPTSQDGVQCTCSGRRSLLGPLLPRGEERRWAPPIQVQRPGEAWSLAKVSFSLVPPRVFPGETLGWT